MCSGIPPVSSSSPPSEDPAGSMVGLSQKALSEGNGFAVRAAMPNCASRCISALRICTSTIPASAVTTVVWSDW